MPYSRYLPTPLQYLIKSTKQHSKSQNQKTFSFLEQWDQFYLIVCTFSVGQNRDSQLTNFVVNIIFCFSQNLCFFLCFLVNLRFYLCLMFLFIFLIPGPKIGHLNRNFLECSPKAYQKSSRGQVLEIQVVLKLLLCHGPLKIM